MAERAAAAAFGRESVKFADPHSSHGPTQAGSGSGQGSDQAKVKRSVQSDLAIFEEALLVRHPTWK